MTDRRHAAHTEKSDWSALKIIEGLSNHLSRGYIFFVHVCCDLQCVILKCIRYAVSFGKEILDRSHPTSGFVFYAKI